MAVNTFVGKVVSDKMKKTVVVEIERRVAHPLYKRIVRTTKRIKADTGAFQLKVGDVVKIRETRPMSHDKRFVVTETYGTT